MTDEAYIFVCPTCFREYTERRDTCEDDDSPLRRIQLSIEDPMLGRVLDERYVIEAKVGEGGMGAVYRAQQLSVDRKIAIKTMHTSSAKGEEYIGRFLREANIASRVNHPHLVTIYDFGQTEDGILYIVMEFLQGLSLAERVYAPRPLTLGQVLTVGIQMCSALAAAHDANIVHRDLKPDNIHMIDVPGGDIFSKLLDFGIAKSVGQEKSMTQTGQVFGTPDYMSPEQCRGETDIDARADLYALGCILYELLTGTTPYADESMLKVLFQHVSAPLPDMIPRSEAYQDDAFVPVLNIVTKLLRKNRAHRYRNALEARDAITQALESLGEKANIQLPGWTRDSEEPEDSIRDLRMSEQITRVVGEEPGVAPTPKIGDLPKATVVQSDAHIALSDTLAPPGVRTTPTPKLLLQTPQPEPTPEEVSPAPEVAPEPELIKEPAPTSQPNKLLIVGLALLLVPVGALVAYAFVQIEPEISEPIANIPAPKKRHPKPAPAPEPDATQDAQPDAAPADATPDLPPQVADKPDATPEVKKPPVVAKKTRKKPRKKPTSKDATLPFRTTTSIVRLTKSRITRKARACLAIANKRDPNLIPPGGKASLVYHYTLKADGKVRSVQPRPDLSNISSPRVDACIKSAFKKLNYGPPAFGERPGSIYEYKATFSYKTREQ